MRYTPLLNLRLTHTYTADRRCTDFQIEPTLETRKLLDNYRCILRPVPGGVRVLMAVAADGAPFIAPRKGMSFAFQLRLRNPDFALFTDLTKIDKLAAPLYTNAGVTAGEPVQLELVSRASPAAPPRASGALADVEIDYGDSAPTIAASPRVFQIDFQAKQARWKYYIVTDSADAKFRIEDKEKEAPLAFGAAVDLKRQPDRSDDVATALARQYPEMRQLRLVSEAAIPCRQTARKAIQLFVDDNLALASLPNPSPRNYSIGVEQDGLPAENALFQVVKYVTQLVSTSGG
jgi:hypothetical protein